MRSIRRPSALKPKGRPVCLAIGVFGISGISMFAFGGALLSILLVYGLTRIKSGFSVGTMLLAGVALNFDVKVVDFSPDGRLIAFTSQHEAVGLSVLPQIYTVRVDGTGLVRRTEGGTGKADLIWRPRP